MVTIQELNAAAVGEALPQLVDLFTNAVEDGASLGFLLPVDMDAVRTFWQGRLAAVGAGTSVLLVAMVDSRVVGAVPGQAK